MAERFGAELRFVTVMIGKGIGQGLFILGASDPEGITLAWPNTQIAYLGAEGGAAVGKSSMMAPWGTTLSEDDINSLIVFIRTLADPPYEGPVPGES